MIETLRVEGIAIVDRAELEFGPGLNVLTGETGAGKSIVLGALALLVGGRASAGSIREGRDDASVEALFRLDGQPDLAAELERRGFETADGELVARRTVARNGRSRARLAGEGVPVSTLAELLSGRVEISSQHESHALLRPDAQARILDRVGGLDETRAAVANTYATLRDLDAERDELARLAREREQRRDFLAFQVEEIEAAALDAEDAAALRTERSRLANAETLQEAGGAALSLLAGDAFDGDESGAGDRLGEARRRLEALADLDPELTRLGERIASAEAEVREAAGDLERHLAGLEADPARLAVVDDRIDAMDRLHRKYGASVEEVLRFRDDAARELASIEGAGERAGALDAERADAESALAKRADRLSAGRRKAATALARAVQASLRELAIPKARFEVGLEPVPAPDGMPCGPSGREAVEFRFSANEGDSLRPLRKVASGGELSRVLLALKNAARGAESGMVLVFDEVDAAIGGRAADRVGRALAELAEHHQVLCITHLPQIAAFAHVHFRVEKSGRGGRTQARISRVEGAERVEEIARMAGGERVGEATRRHARELLGARGGL